MRLPIAFACAMALAAPALAETLVPTACSASLDRAASALTQARLKAVGNVPRAETCSAARRHFIAMVNARAVAATCRSGAAREAELQKLDAAVEDLNGVIAETCG